MQSVEILFIDTSEKLSTWVGRLQQKQEIAIDLEFDKNYYRYGFNMCLVQIFDGNNCLLIDPLSRGIDIGLLFPVLENSSIQKVCFSFDEDLRLLHSMGCFPKNLFDLDTASRLLNYPAMSLTNLLMEMLDRDPGKSSQRSNWFKRPLTKAQKTYAANDVLHLLDLKEVLVKKAREKEVLAWIEEENKALDRLNYSSINEEEKPKEKYRKHLNEMEWFLYEAVLEWRQKMAKKFNKPAFQLFSDKTLLDIATSYKKPSNLCGRKGIYKKLKSPSIEQQLDEVITRAVKEAKQSGCSEEKPARPSKTSEELKQLNENRRKVNHFKNNMFNPVKNLIEEEYGSETASFILSNRIITDLVLGNNGPVKSYKKELILKCAGQLDIEKSEIQELFQQNQS